MNRYRFYQETFDLYADVEASSREAARRRLRDDDPCWADGEPVTSVEAVPPHVRHYVLWKYREGY